MATSRIRTLDFLPEIFQTPTNAQFLGATLDKLVDQPKLDKIEGYVGSKFGYGINANDHYVVEPTKARTDYQLDPGVVFTKPNEGTAQDFISYPGILDALNLEGALVENNNRLFNSQFYSWDSFTNLDKIINFHQYYWLPEGPAPVIVSSSTIYSVNDYIVTDVVNGYQIAPINSPGGSTNPTLTLLRGGTYTFSVDQAGQFWIQGEPGVTGFSATQPNLQTRDVLGVNNNGVNEGIVTFVVPQANAQDVYNFPGNNLVSVVSTTPYDQINGARVYDLNNIDGITSLEGLTIMFYNTGISNEQGYISNFFDYTSYDVNNDLVADETITITATSSVGNKITCNSTAGLVVGNSITFIGSQFGGIQQYSTTVADTLYYVESITSGTEFTISLSIGGPAVTLSTATGTMTGNINQGLLEEGYYTNVSETFYTITYIGDPSDPVIRLVPAGSIPVEQKITATYGTQWGARNFYKNSGGAITLIPYLSAALDTLYYQDGTSADKVGLIRLVESNNTNSIDINADILGRATYTSPTGVVFTNGLKVTFQGAVTPVSYQTGEYYVQGVGTAIELIPTTDLIVPETFTSSTYVPWDTTAWDIGNWEGNSYIPVTPDYITISRNSIDKNAWSRSNRWFHIDVINATATYNNNPDLVALYATTANKAKRPIIEFYPDLKLFNSGSYGLSPVDFIDSRTTDAFALVAGQENYYPDVTVYTAYTATLTSTNYTPTRTVTASSAITNYFTIDSTTGFNVNDLIVFETGTIGGVTTGVNYYIAEVASPTQITLSTAKNGAVYIPTTASGSVSVTWVPQSTTITVLGSDVTGTFAVDQYIVDSTNLLPRNATITSVSGTTTITLGVTWNTTGGYFDTTSVASLIATDTTPDNYALFDGSTVIFAADTNAEVRNKIYISRFSKITESSPLTLTLTEIADGLVLPNEQTVILRGYENTGVDYFFDGVSWTKTQQKVTVNQAPLFDVFDNNGISFGDTDVYTGSSFVGSKLFAYGIGSGTDDAVLSFPLRYSSIENVGDISFDVNLNIDTFNYVSGTTPITQQVNTGYVYSYNTRTDYTRLIGWQTAVSPSIQYQIFEFKYELANPTSVFTCDIAMVDSTTTNWPTIQVFINNVIQATSDYTVTTTDTTTSVTLSTPILTDTVVQILVLSDQVSKTAYYGIPTNLNNNPLNADIKTANIGDIRGQYQSIFYNNPNTTGEVFGANNYRDLGNLVPYGNKIIQNSASLVLPAAFLRKQDHSLFNSLLFNNREYIKFKTLLVDTVNNSGYEQRYDPASMLDDALDQITTSKTKEQPFFWSDMLPSKAAFISNSYSFANSLDVSIYPLSRVYDFTKANYYGVLVYLTRTTSNLTTVTQLIKDQDYTVSSTAPSLTVTLDLLPGDKITVNEFNQTYGSYVPNTPTKLGLYPSFIPKVILDSDYTQPTYFIRGHDGSYTKLYGSYDPDTGVLVDFRDQVLLEYELRVYNNLKIDAVIPIQEYEVLPGFFRETDYTYEEWLEIYGTSFLDWIGQNRINYKRQLYNANDEYTFNYWQSANKINKAPISQGYWRGIYQYFYDTTTPNLTPWEMLGLKEQPSWWETRYGVSPYTSDNLVLWNDLAAGINWNNGDPVVIPQAIRPELLKVLPVDSAGNLLSPFIAIVGNYNSNIFQREWKVGDAGPAEFSYRRSSSYPFDLMRILALTKPAEFFNLGVDIDNYKYNEEFNQYLVNDRSHLVITDIEIYGSGTAKTSYINWIVDYEKQLGIDATNNITSLFENTDVRLVYRLAGFSDKAMLKFYVEKGSPNSTNASLLIPDESYAVLLYDNQPFNRIIYSGIVVQIVNNGFAVFGNSQTQAYFKTLKPVNNGNLDSLTVEKLSVKLAKDYSSTEVLVPYSTTFYTAQEVAQFITSYGAYLDSLGMVFDDQELGLQINWKQMVAEFLYWAQTGWEEGSIVTLNPAAKILKINKDSNIVQPLTLHQANYMLNQNMYPIQNIDLSIVRDGTLFSAQALNQGDSISYGQFNIGNMEHGIVFDNVTVFDDILYNLTTGLRQTRITVRGTKTAEWNGTVDASGFIYNQDNILEWNRETKYTQGSIVKYKTKFWTALKIVQPAEIFNELEWKQTNYDEIQKGLLPNSSTRSYESTLYYDVNQANLENDADLLSFSLIGYRPRDYLAIADLTDITQINVYKNLIKEKGTLNAANVFKGAQLAQGGINYDIYENWAIKSGEFGGTLNSNFIQFKVNENYMTGNPSIVGLTDGVYNVGVQQEVPIYSLFNYGRPIDDVNVLPQIASIEPSVLYSDAGYVNFNDVTMSSYFYSQLANATDASGVAVPIQNFYVRDYAWIANFLEKWQVFTPTSLGAITEAKNNLNNTVTITFANPHNLAQYQPFAIVNFNPSVDGYYVATIVVDNYRVIINLALDPNVRTLTGLGVGMSFQSQRVDTPADINNLPLLDAEFRKNTVWVDTNDDGSWAVLRKSINYAFEEEFVKESTQTFGSSVACGDPLGYLIGDADAGQAYRYVYDELTQTYLLTQTLTGSTSFGATIAHADDIFVIAEPTSGSPKVYIYQLENNVLSTNLVSYQTPIDAPALETSWANALAISGDKNWLFIANLYNSITPNVSVYRKSQLTGEYEYATEIDTPSLSFGNGFAYSIATDYYGDTLIVGNPYENYSSAITSTGNAYVYDRAVQRVEAQYNSIPLTAQRFQLAWAHPTLSRTATATTSVGNFITLNSVTSITVDDPIIFTGTGLSGTNITSDVVYYVRSIVGSTITIKETRDSVDAVTLTTAGSLSITTTVQYTPIYVSVNGTLVDDNNYAIVGTTLVYTGTLTAGDVVTVSGQLFTLMQTLTSNNAPKLGAKFGTSVATTIHASEILIGAPFDLSAQNNEGAVYRFTNSGGKFGTVIGTTECNVTAPRTLLINGYMVTIPVGDASTAANAINSVRITNVTASALDGKLIIQVINSALAQSNEELVLSVVDTTTLSELGISVYSQTQTITCPHLSGSTQFGTTVKFNDRGSFVASAPTGTRYEATTFDFSDDENQSDDTIFDNNATQWIDTYPNAGAVYMFDYLPVYNETLNNPGSFVYAQSINATNETYGSQPMYGTALDFCNDAVIVGTPNFDNDGVSGQVVTYTNSSGEKDWSVYRSSSEVVDINRIFNIQLFSASTNDTLINLDYIDPLQGKILGAVRENIDIVSNVDPAGYNSSTNISGLVWGIAQVGQIWFDTKNVKFVNYHQNDVSYNSKYWGTLFPGSDVAVYTWIASNTVPASYAGPGTPYRTDVYTTQYSINPSGALTATYYFWVRNTNTVFVREGKTLADSVIASYIQSPKNSGISYFAPLLPNVFALYNCADFINANDSVLSIGYATGTNDDPAHNQYSLIRTDFSTDFLPGVPKLVTGTPESLYDRLLDSMSGADESGAVVPNPYLPKLVQYGVQARPRQSFFINRFGALQNYLTYANEILAQFPISELRQATLLDKSGVFYNTTDYWQYVDWWATGYSSNTKSALQVPIYADLATLSVPEGTIVTVASNGSGNSEVYVLEAGIWNRIGLSNGTIEFKSSLWDYATARLGFGDNFFDTTPFDQYPSEETRNILRALNEQIYTEDLLIYRNKSLILLFEYIQSETVETQNYLPWLNKTSFIDVAHTIRELRPIEVFQSDNQTFLAGYLNEVKPYHVVIKEFLFKYTGSESYEGFVSDFDLPAQYNTTVEKFITPELVYSNPNGDNEYLPTDPIWENTEYSQWFANHGLSLTGQDNVQITTLVSYIALNSTEIAVNNAQGLPINGVLRIGTEEIGYATVDRSSNTLSGLTRGVNGTTVDNHIPGTLIYINLPAALLLDGGRGYVEPPKVTAYIDTSIYPEPTRPAVLTAVMNVDSVLKIDVVDPGQGYAKLPEIIIDPAVISTFTSSAVNTLSSTIQLFAPLLQTGDLVRYRVGANSTPIGGLQDNQWYYVNLLETVPTVQVALYDNYGDAVNNENRLTLFTAGTGNNHSLNVGAKASAVTTAVPVRENNVTIRFDRTTYDSALIDWVEGSYYGSFFAGNYLNSKAVSSSSIQLESTRPDIDTILASAQGVAFEIAGIENDREITYSSFLRIVESTTGASDVITLTLQDDGSGNPNASGSTLGFYVGMPVKFVGAVIGGIVEEVVYYVNSIVSDTEFTISETEGGSIFDLSTATVSPAGLSCLVGQVVDTAILTVNYPGIAKVTATESVTNALTLPFNPTGTGGTNGFYIDIPVFFTGTLIGGVIENQIYYVTTIIDEQTFTMSETKNPDTYTISDTTSGTNIVTLQTGDSTNLMYLNQPIIFNTMLISGNPVTNFGNIISGQLYYISNIVDNNEIQISTAINGSPLALSTATGSALMTSQENVVTLTTDSGSDMVININLPVSPGQVNGQKFTLYNTSVQYPNISGVDGSLISRDIEAVLGTPETVALTSDSGGLTNIYVNMPIQVSESIGALSSGVTYYVKDTGTTEITVTNTTSSGNLLTCDTTELLFINMPIIFSNVGLGGIELGVEYYVKTITSGTQFTITNTPGGTTTTLTTSNGTMVGTGSVYVQLSTTVGGAVLNPGNSQQTATISIAAPGVVTVALAPANLTTVEFRTTGTLPTGLSEGTIYYVRNRTATTFNVSLTPTSTVITTSGAQSGIHTVIVADTVTLDQVPDTSAVFDVSYLLGGYRVIIATAGSGYAVDNTILIDGTNMGGTSPANDLTLTVNTISTTGEITSVICSGTVPGVEEQYYLKVISLNQFKVYSNSLLTVPVSGIDFPYSPISSDTVTNVSTTATGTLTISDTSVFVVNDAVVFTGDVQTSITNIVEGTTYYIYDILSPTTFRISTLPGDLSTIVAMNSTTTVSFLMSRIGSYALLPEPVIFNQSIVKYNNRVYTCIVSNNDPEFVFGKWELLDSGDRRLNALDRIKGYYQPTSNMPGLDLTQLVSNITYPNSTYLGNAFAPEDQFTVDTILSDQPFYPVDIDIQSIVWNGTTYIGVADTPTYSSLVESTNAASWQITKLANTPVGTRDILYVSATGKYIIVTQNPATAIYTSADGIIWTVVTDVAGLLADLNSVTYGAGKYIAVGNSILTGTDISTWNRTYQFANPLFNNELFGVTYVDLPAFTGFVAVGSGQTFDYSTGVGELININLVLVSVDGINWNQSTPVTNKSFNAVTTNTSLMVAVGDDGIIYTSQNGSAWLGVNETEVIGTNGSTDTVNVANASSFAVDSAVRVSESFDTLVAGTTYYVAKITTSTQLLLSPDSSTTIAGSFTPGQVYLINTIGTTDYTLIGAATNTVGITFTATGVGSGTGTARLIVNLTGSGSIPLQTVIFQYPQTTALRDITYASSLFVAVGDTGLIRTSPDAATWTTRTSGVTTNLNGITYDSTNSRWVAVGDNNVILTSVDSGITWTETSLFVTDPTIYNVQGAEFQFGYGPEELVPGVVTDNLMLTVETRPGTDWPDTEYQHVGYNVVSREYTPTFPAQVDYSFASVVQTPAQIVVYSINGTTGLGTTLHSPSYSVNWVTGVVTLETPLTFSPVPDRLRIDVYEVGSGNQLVKSSTKNDPILTNTTTGWNEINIDCNYTGSIFNGSGVIRPDSGSSSTAITETDSTTNTITCESVTNFVVNDPVTFQGTPFGNLAENTTYYIKTISSTTNKITISASLNLGTGTAGPTFAVTTASGAMFAITGSGTGTVWTDPIIYHNGTKLLRGYAGAVTRTQTGTNVITCSSTAGFNLNGPIVFSTSVFGGLVAGTTYYIKTIIDSTTFTVSATAGGATFALTDATGGASFLTNDYTFGIASNGITAKIIFATGAYVDTTDYITYTIFGETIPYQYGYTIPETQTFTSTGATTVFTLTNFVGSDNPSNSIVEVDGLRLTNTTDYTINGETNQITFVVAPALNAVITVTSFNLTERQYLHTSYGLTSKTVANISAINNSISPPIATTNVTNTTTGTNRVTCSSTTGFVIDQPIIFKGASAFGNILVDGTVYFVKSIVSATQFTISATQGGATFALTTASGLMVAYVGGIPAVRVTTAINHNLSENSVVRIDGTMGSTQLNNNIYYAKIISATQFDLYFSAYNPAYAAVNSPVTDISAYTSGGYVWKDGTYTLATTTVSATATDPITGNKITAASTSELVVDTAIIFTEFGSLLGTDIMGGLIAGTTYYVREIFNSTQFSVSATRGGSEFVLTNDAGAIVATQWEQDNVDRLWVTINGARVPSSALRINPANYVSILSTVTSTDKVTITSMMPSATPNAEVYMLNVDRNEVASVYRANTQTRTWLTRDLYSTDDTIYLRDITRITDTITQVEITPAAIDSLYNIGLTADKRLISSIAVYNNTKAASISSSNFNVVVEELAPILQIDSGTWITEGDSLTIVVTEGNTLYINGEQIKFSTVDATTNTVSGLQRGANGTGEQDFIPIYSEVFGFLSNNRLADDQYTQTWNSNIYNETDGDPLQISNTDAAIFLNTDVN